MQPHANKSISKTFIQSLCPQLAPELVCLVFSLHVHRSFILFVALFCQTREPWRSIKFTHLRDDRGIGGQWKHRATLSLSVCLWAALVRSAEETSSVSALIAWQGRFPTSLLHLPTITPLLLRAQMCLWEIEIINRQELNTCVTEGGEIQISIGSFLKKRLLLSHLNQ